MIGVTVPASERATPPLLPPSGLLTDLYHVDAALIAWRANLTGPATFDLYTRSLPFGGGYLLVAGLEQAIDFVQSFRYSDDDIAYLASIRAYDPAFLDQLRQTRFTGEIAAMPEGTVAFGHEPLLRVTAPYREALLVESGLLHAVSVSTLIATKAARIVEAAAGRAVTEFSFRRAQAPFIVARSAAIGGCVATSFVAGARAYGLPAAGTVPHALIQAFETEEAAFTAIAESLDRYTLLLDTYDVRRAIGTAVRVALNARRRWNHQLSAVRLDSGDLAADARYVRGVLDDAGLGDVRILASGDLDEFRIAALIADKAPIDGFGVGTSLGVGAGSASQGIDGGALGAVYKLVAFGEGASAARIKLAGIKSTWPGVKQVYRRGSFGGDEITLVSEPPPSGAEALLHPIVSGGRRIPGTLPPLEEIRKRAKRDLAALPAVYRRFSAPAVYPVAWSPALQALRHAAGTAGWQAGQRPTEE